MAKTKSNGKAKQVKKKISERDRKMAKFCLNCTVCKHARKQQKGLAFVFVQKIEGKFCPFCKAYERVYGRKAHQRII
ncbi:MAG: hypothetical protein LLG40_07760 [Deltaproteobacteria bacterium]|nr:hypothetical protein [Deltaproteobacteria bacterium]